MEERWDFLVPWCYALNKRFDYNHLEFDDDPHGSQKRRLVVTLPMRKFCSGEETFRFKFQQVREGLMLLSTVAHVDQNAWKYLLSKYCGVDLGEKGGEKSEQDISARFLLILDLEERQKEESEELVDSDLVEFCGVGQREVQSGEFRNALQKIAALKTGKPGVDVEIPVQVLYRARQPFSAMGDRPVEELLKAARAERVIKAEWDAYRQFLEDEKVKSGSFRCTFVLEPMIADLSNFPVRADLVETLSALMDDNVWFSRMTLYLSIDSKLKTDELSTKKVFGQLATSVFDSKRRFGELSNTKYCSWNTTSSPHQLGTLVLYCGPSLTAEQFETLCSAIVVSQTVKRLSLSLWLDPTDTNTSTTKWKWLAYALFSKRARESSALESLSLTSIGSMSVADIEAFNAVLMSDYPEEEIFGTPHGQVSRGIAVLAKEARILNYSEDEEQHLMVKSPVASVRTFSDDGHSEWVNAIIAGYGRCLVRRNDLIFEQNVRTNQRRISSLTIGFGDFNTRAMDGLGHFLKAVGPSLKMLALDTMRTDVDVNFIQQCCPNLEELSLRSGVTDVRFNFSEWHENKQPLPALEDDWTDAIAVAAQLQDSYSSFMRCLRRLRVRLNNVRNVRDEHDQHRIKTILAGLLQMLEVNQTLEYLDIVAPSEYHDLFDDLRMHHLKPIGRSIPLLVQSKVAFLSIFRSLRKPTQQCNTFQSGFRFGLDQHVLHKIFQFAASPIRCEVYAHGLDWVDKYNDVPI